jgi:hypothetical protein
VDFVLGPVRGVETGVSPDEGSRLLVDVLGAKLSFRKLGAHAVIDGMMLQSLGKVVNWPKPSQRLTSKTLISEAQESRNFLLFPSLLTSFPYRWTQEPIVREGEFHLVIRQKIWWLLSSQRRCCFSRRFPPPAAAAFHADKKESILCSADLLSFLKC